jgi:hypothetical protein
LVLERVVVGLLYGNQTTKATVWAPQNKGNHSLAVLSNSLSVHTIDDSYHSSSGSIFSSRQCKHLTEVFTDHQSDSPFLKIHPLENPIAF